MRYRDLIAEHPRFYDKPGSPYFQDVMCDGWQWEDVKYSPITSRGKICHICGARGTGGTCDSCLNALQLRAEHGLEIFE